MVANWRSAVGELSAYLDRNERAIALLRRIDADILAEDKDTTAFTAAHCAALKDLFDGGDLVIAYMTTDRELCPIYGSLTNQKWK